MRRSLRGRVAPSPRAERSRQDSKTPSRISWGFAPWGVPEGCWPGRCSAAGCDREEPPGLQDAKQNFLGLRPRGCSGGLLAGPLQRCWMRSRGAAKAQSTQSRRRDCSASRGHRNVPGRSPEELGFASFASLRLSSGDAARVGHTRGEARKISGLGVLESWRLLDRLRSGDADRVGHTPRGEARKISGLGVLAAPIRGRGSDSAPRDYRSRLSRWAP
jgi:hypothetical protein